MVVAGHTFTGVEGGGWGFERFKFGIGKRKNGRFQGNRTQEVKQIKKGSDVCSPRKYELTKNG